MWRRLFLPPMHMLSDNVGRKVWSRRTRSQAWSAHSEAYVTASHGEARRGALTLADSTQCATGPVGLGRIGQSAPRSRSGPPVRRAGLRRSRAPSARDVASPTA